MSWFQLDPQSLAQRARESGKAPPSLAASLTRGMVGFTLLSLAGFAPWALFGLHFYNTVGEFGLYVACALVFIVCSGPLLHRLIIGHGSLARFYQLFGPAFAAYAAVWIFCYMMITGDEGFHIGFLVGTAIMGWMFTRAFDAPRAILPVVAALFTLSEIGFLVGGWADAKVMRMPSVTLWADAHNLPHAFALAQLLWGVGYGVGLGAGLGLAFYLCQAKASEILRNDEKL